MSNEHTPRARPTSTKRAQLPAIDTDPSRQSVRIGAEVPEVWGTRIKDHLADLSNLCRSELLRNRFPDVGAGCARDILSMTGGARRLVHECRSDLIEAFRPLSPARAEISCEQVLQVLEIAHSHAHRTLESRGWMDAQRREVLGLFEKLVDLPQQSRDMHQFASSLDSQFRGHATSTDSDLREAAVLMAFVASAVRCLAPSPIKGPINACVLCHRHCRHRIVCLHHGSGPQQAQRLRQRQALSRVNDRLQPIVESSVDLFVDLASQWPASLDGVDAAFDALFRRSSAPLVAAWDRARSEATSVDDLWVAWCGLPEVDDPWGIERWEQPTASRLFKFMSDIARFEASSQGHT
jgi:hypothetical protein